MGQLQKYKEDYILLVEAGFIAVNQADEDSAVKLFKAAELLDPSNLLPKIGFGYIHLCKLELKQAAKVFEEILAKDPNNEMAKTFLGLSLSLNPTETAKGEKVLEESANSAKDPMIKNLAVTALDFVEKFVKKAPTPSQAQTTSKKK
ncbi:MAG: SctF chaperone SctG [Rhabdochlamydiaceae bacterium]|nr:SctF chaperone SctG [Rhabdochlamydiaceae bacterium]